MSRILASTLAAGLAAAHAADGDPGATRRARYLMGTLCTAVVESADTALASRAIAGAFDEIARLERVMSSWRSDSELSRLNATGGGAWFACSPDLYAALDSSRTFAALTGGAFDPTIEPLNRAWDSRGQGRIPGSEAAALARSLVGWRHLSLDPEGRRAHLARGGMGLDLGGIGKGLALDRAAAVLESRGVTRALLNLGGEALALGDGWDVLVAHPAERLRPVVRLSLSGGAVSTSAQSERGVVVRERRYGHVFDPRSGRPVEGSGSVTVVAGSATRADALSTALLVMGREAAAGFARSHPELGILWLEPAGESVRAWKWNLGPVAADPGTAVEWVE